VSMFTKFDSASEGGILYEAQAADRDSGTAVFRKNGAQWELIGIVNTIYTFNGQPFPTAVYGDYTSFADLTYYRGEILNIMNAHAGFSVTGDVNLDGVISGNGTGSAATDDVTAFVQGWNWQQGQPNVESWKKGDLNLDGMTNVSDFFLMRNALSTAGLGAGVTALTSFFGGGSGGGVPEPTTLVLLAAGAFLAGGIGRRRRSN
jgi:PEP-CTERM motif